MDKRQRKITPSKKTLSDRLKECDFSAPVTKEIEKWDSAPPAGKEVI